MEYIIENVSLQKITESKSVTSHGELSDQIKSVAQSCPTLSNPMDCSPPGSSVHAIFQARVLEWGAIAFSTSIT